MATTEKTAETTQQDESKLAEQPVQTDLPMQTYEPIETAEANEPEPSEKTLQRGGEDAGTPGNLDALKKNGMMAHLIESLEAGKDIGHYGRLTFAMVARHFLNEDELLAMLRKDSDFSEAQASLLIRQVEGKDYNPPKRDRILAWQKEQEFPICPNPEDPDNCNVYKDLNFPDHVYEHIQHYVEKKAESGS